MNKVKTLVSIAAALVLLLSVAAPVAFSDGEGTVSGSFAPGNVAPTVDSVVLHKTGGSPTPTSSMTPQTEYNVKVTVSDANILDDLSTVRVIIMYDSDGNWNTSTGGHDTGSSNIPDAGDAQYVAVLTWTNGGSPEWNMYPTSTSWTIETANCVAPSLAASNGTFEFHFKPGKVACEATATDKWHIYAKADDGSATADNYQDNCNMYWYGEIGTSSPSIVHFGSVTPGADFGDSTKRGPISITYISNGAYDEKVKTDATWTGDPSGTATLSTTGYPGSSQFSLKADDTATLASAVLVNTDGVTIDESGTMTGESGDTVANYLWLKLGGAFACATYNGTITYMIANGS